MERLVWVGGGMRHSTVSRDWLCESIPLLAHQKAGGRAGTKGPKMPTGTTSSQTAGNASVRWVFWRQWERLAKAAGRPDTAMPPRGALDDSGLPDMRLRE